MKGKLNWMILLAMIGLVASRSKKVKVNWGALGIGSVIAFLAGWWLFGLIGAIVLAIIVMVLLGIITIGK
jgi:hypothetical protein